MKTAVLLAAAIVAAVLAPTSSAAAVPLGNVGLGSQSTFAKEPEIIGGFVLFRRDSSSGKMEYLLLEKESEPGDWSPPKGHVEKGEVPLDAAFRELREETTVLPQHVNVMYGLLEYFEYETKDGDEKKVSLWPAELLEWSHPIIISPELRAYKWTDTTETLQIVKKQYKQAYVNAIQSLYCHFDTNVC